MKRLFIALPVPAPLSAAIARVQQAPFAARWQSAGQLHLTLAFVGDVDERGARDLADALGSIHAEPPTLSLAGVGHFASKGRAHSLWAGVSPREPVAALAAKVAEACRRAGCPVEARRYVPHITVARLRIAETAVVPWLIAGGTLTSAAVTIDRFGLYESRLSPAGASYDLLAEWPLH